VTVLAWSSAFVAIRWADAPAGATAGVVYLGVVPTAVAFSTWAYALARMDAGRLGVTTYLVAPLTIVMAWVLLGEVPPQVERCYARQV
jgi:drug/metabolite transporter (DMT)-like permease